MIWHEVDKDDLKAIPSGAAALGPPMSPSPQKQKCEIDVIGWTPPKDSGDQAVAGLRRCRPVAENVSRPQMKAALDPNALAYASEAVAAAALAAKQNDRVVVPPLSIPRNHAAPPRERAEWYSRLSYESDGEELLCGVPGLGGLPTSLAPGADSSGIWATMSDWLTPWFRRPPSSGSVACCSVVGSKPVCSSRALSAESLGESEESEEAEPERQSSVWLPRDQAPTPAPACVAAAVGPLGVPIACRQRQTPLSAIYELPAQLSSGTFDEMRSSLFESSIQVTSEDARAREADMPDPVLLGLTPAEELAHPPCGSCHGLGRARRGHVGPIGYRPSVLITELLLPRQLDARQVKSVHAALRARIPLSGDIAASFGAVPARLECGGAGIWAVWFDGIGAAAVQPEWPLPWKPQNVPLASSSLGARPLHEALRMDLAMSSSHMPQWRLAVACEIAAAIASLHQTGRSHGSLTPCSIWVSPNASVSIIETGLVDVLLETGVLHEHELLSCLGLEFARYLAPEGWQIPRRTDAIAGAAADVWALGLILLEVLGCSSSPHSECKTLQQLSSKVLPKRGHQPAPRLRSDGEYGRLPEVARRKLEACLNASPEARPSAVDVLSSLATPAGMSCASDFEVGTICKESCMQDKLQQVRAFSDASTSPSFAPSTSATRENSTFSSASSSLNVPQNSRDSHSREHRLEDKTIQSYSKSSLGGGHCDTLQPKGNSQPRDMERIDDMLPVDDQKCAPRSKNEFYSGIIESSGSELSSENVNFTGSHENDELVAKTLVTEMSAATSLNFQSEENKQSGQSIDVWQHIVYPSNVRSVSPAKPDLEKACSQQGSVCQDVLQDSLSSRRSFSAESKEAQPLTYIRTPRDIPPPPPEPTFEEMLLALPTPVRNRARAEVAKEKLTPLVVSKKVPPPPPAAAPPLTW